jgi:hypothetical protein
MGQLKSVQKIPLANINDSELGEIKELEQKLMDKYYLIAYDKSVGQPDNDLSLNNFAFEVENHYQF